MIQLLIIYFISPDLYWETISGAAARADVFLRPAVAFIFNYACYFSEIYRGGIQGVPHGQEEAGTCAGHDEEPDLFQR